jgi:agmatine/peptidylarginine deiminase
MLYRILPLALVALCVSPAFGQDDIDLPQGLAPHELELIPAYRDSRAGLSRGISTPPDFPVRTMAEWEEVQSLVVTWTSYTGILKQIVRYAKEECEVIIVCSNANTVSAYLMNTQYGGPLDDLDNITFLEEPFNSIWVRDFGPEVIYRNEVDSLYLLDWIYNRPRPSDDALSDALGTLKNIPVYSTTQAPYDLVHTGGNFMADGFGTAFSSALVLEENGPNGDFNQTVKTEAQVDAIMEQFMGIQPGRYIKMEQLPYDNISHIDMHMKLIDEETLLVGEFPVGVSDGPQLEANMQYVTSTFNSVFDTPYELVRIPMVPSTGGAYPPSASYRTFANNIFINGTVLVPTYRTEYDTTGLRILREALPGYKVYGIDSDNSDQNIISASGAIHCITKAIGVEDPLLIRHQRLRDTYETVVPYTVEGYLRHRSGIASARVYWTVDTAQGFAALDMVDQGNGNWAAAIPAQPIGTQVFYYIEGTANSGKEQVRPIVAPEGWWRFRVLGVSTNVADLDGPAIVEVFPNPTTSLVMISVDGSGNERVRITLVDAMGREVMRIHQGPMHRDGRAFADLSYLGEGAYLVVVENARGRSVNRVVKQ